MNNKTRVYIATAAIVLGGGIGIGSLLAAGSSSAHHSGPVQVKQVDATAVDTGSPSSDSPSPTDTTSAAASTSAAAPVAPQTTSQPPVQVVTVTAANGSVVPSPVGITIGPAPLPTSKAPSVPLQSISTSPSPQG